MYTIRGKILNLELPWTRTGGGNSRESDGKDAARRPEHQGRSSRRRREEGGEKGGHDSARPDGLTPDE